MKLFKTTGLAIAALMLTTAGVAPVEPASRRPARRPSRVLRPLGRGDPVLPVSRQDRARSGSALANGYIANTWRIQMIQTAKAYAAQPEVAAKLTEFKVVSTGEDVPAQISAINNFIDSGYDAIVVNAQNPTAFAPVIKRAKDAGVILVAFDNILDTEDAINVNVDQKGLGVLLGRLAGQALYRTAARSSKCAASPAPRSTPTATTASTRRSTASGKKWDVVEVRRQVGRPDRAEGHGRRHRRAQEVRRHHRAGRRHRRGAGDDRRQASLRAVRRRDRERLPQVLRASSRAKA